MKLSGKDRAIMYYDYIRVRHATIRQTAEHFLVSKSTVHRCIHRHLPQINKAWYAEVQQIFAGHVAVRARRGGISTQLKWLRKRLQET